MDISHTEESSVWHIITKYEFQKRSMLKGNEIGLQEKYT